MKLKRAVLQYQQEKEWTTSVEKMQEDKAKLLTLLKKEKKEASKDK